MSIEQTLCIPANQYEIIRQIDVDEHAVDCNDFSHWKGKFSSNPYLAERICFIENSLGSKFNRSRLVEFYKSDLGMETKFLATMIWGHEAVADGRRDNRGPWKVLQMFKSPSSVEKVIEDALDVQENKIESAYEIFNKSIPRCGPNFFTKHFYFMGKAKGLDPYPLIFDDRVAAGIVHLFAQQSKSTDKKDPSLSMVRVSAARTASAYKNYLTFVRKESNNIGCDLDQIEYYLFNLARKG